MRIPRRKNPQAPWRWQHQDAHGQWRDDLRDAEYSYRELNSDERRTE